MCRIVSPRQRVAALCTPACLTSKMTADDVEQTDILLDCPFRAPKLFRTLPRITPIQKLTERYPKQMQGYYL